MAYVYTQIEGNIYCKKDGIPLPRNGLLGACFSTTEPFLAFIDSSDQLYLYQAINYAYRIVWNQTADDRLRYIHSYGQNTFKCFRMQSGVFTK